MTFFSALRTLFSRKDKRLISSNDDTEKRKRASNNNSHIMNTRSVASPTGSTKQSSGNGYTFQYKDGRRYHGDTEVAYVMPNDDDGMLYTGNDIDFFFVYIIATLEADRVHQQHWMLRYALQW
jgi:hypothetical protein